MLGAARPEPVAAVVIMGEPLVGYVVVMPVVDPPGGTVAGSASGVSTVSAACKACDSGSEMFIEYASPEASMLPAIPSVVEESGASGTSVAALVGSSTCSSLCGSMAEVLCYVSVSESARESSMSVTNGMSPASSGTKSFVMSGFTSCAL